MSLRAHAAEAIELRRAGLTYAEIGRRLGIGLSLSHALVARPSLAQRRAARRDCRVKGCRDCGGPKPAGRGVALCSRCKAIRGREFDSRMKARRRAAKNTVPCEDVEALVVLEMDDGACGICGEDVDPLDFTIDHVVPLSRGGPHIYANVQVAHHSCNSRKGARPLEEVAA